MFVIFSKHISAKNEIKVYFNFSLEWNLSKHNELIKHHYRVHYLIQNSFLVELEKRCSISNKIAINLLLKNCFSHPRKFRHGNKKTSDPGVLCRAHDRKTCLFDGTEIVFPPRADAVALFYLPLPPQSLSHAK